MTIKTTKIEVKRFEAQQICSALFDRARQSIEEENFHNCAEELEIAAKFVRAINPSYRKTYRDAIDIIYFQRACRMEDIDYVEP